jgi:hypothetical protein
MKQAVQAHPLDPRQEGRPQLYEEGAEAARFA